MTLPLKLKVHIRDLWTSETSDVQKAFTDLKAIIGYPVQIEPEWPLLWNELQECAADKDTFIPLITQVVVEWCRLVGKLAENEDEGGWTEQMLERVARTQSVRVLLEVGDETSSTTWSDSQNNFTITLPKSGAFKDPSYLSKLHNDLLRVFNPSATTSTSVDTSDDLDTSEFDMLSIATPAPADHVRSSSAQSLDSLPSLNTIPRPEELMKRAPYHLVIYNTSPGKEISVECSHQPSLELIAAYFKKWVKTNHNKTTKPPATIITLKESCFGVNILFDRLHFELDTYNHQHGLTPALIIAFVEGVLGYRMTWQDGGSWQFRRDTGFRA
ncbi:hypothetical protein HDV00_001637 [Rhizophlyctis rosea]|nr:hypothetical protein HDV00_001637 [Rhizophlyctis rosea]